jgi:hypothetical protein
MAASAPPSIFKLIDEELSKPDNTIFTPNTLSLIQGIPIDVNEIFVLNPLNNNVDGLDTHQKIDISLNNDGLYCSIYYVPEDEARKIATSAKPPQWNAFKYNPTNVNQQQFLEQSQEGIKAIFQKDLPIILNNTAPAGDPPTFSFDPVPVPVPDPVPVPVPVPADLSILYTIMGKNTDDEKKQLDLALNAKIDEFKALIANFIELKDNYKKFHDELIKIVLLSLARIRNYIQYRIDNSNVDNSKIIIDDKGIKLDDGLLDTIIRTDLLIEIINHYLVKCSKSRGSPLICNPISNDVFKHIDKTILKNLLQTEKENNIDTLYILLITLIQLNFNINILNCTKNNPDPAKQSLADDMGDILYFNNNTSSTRTTLFANITKFLTTNGISEPKYYIIPEDLKLKKITSFKEDINTAITAAEIALSGKSTPP